ncbi:hypothetical protein ACWGTO_08390 [Mesorhizobium sp. PL10]
MKTENDIPVDLPYDTESFAEKFGLSMRAAEIVLCANGPSKIACDAAARAFVEAVAMRNRQWQRD